MQFQGTIRSRSGFRLGSAEAVEGELQRLFDGLFFEWSRSGAEKLADMEAKGVLVPDLVRRRLHAQPSYRCAEWSDGEIDVTLNLGNGDDVTCIWLTISGDECSGNRVLTLLRGIAGWWIDNPEPLAIVRDASTAQVPRGDTATLYTQEGDPPTDC